MESLVLLALYDRKIPSVLIEEVAIVTPELAAWVVEDYSNAVSGYGDALSLGIFPAPKLCPGIGTG